MEKSLKWILKIYGEWLCKEDRQLYQLQVSSSGRIGYTTEKKAPLKTSYDFDTNVLNNDESCESDENDLSYECNLLVVITTAQLLQQNYQLKIKFQQERLQKYVNQ